MLERMVNAVNSVEHRKKSWGRRQKTDKFENGKAQMAELVQVCALGERAGARRRGCADGRPGKVLYTEVVSSPALCGGSF
jgi:hypothetical protein